MTVAAPTAPSAAETAPGPLSPSRSFHFRSRDGAQLYGELFVPAGDPVAAAVVLHGYAEHCGRYRELAHVLTGMGLAVLSYDMRGHGRSQGQRGLIKRFSEYLDDLDAAIEELDRQLTTSLRLAVVGHSNGGLVTLRALADPWRRPKRAEVAVLSSPFLRLRLKVPAVKAWTARLASVALPALSLPNELVPEHLTSDPAKQRERRLDTLCHDVASARWFTEAQETQAWVQEFAHRIVTPTLWLVSGADQIADPSGARDVHERLTSSSEYHEFPGLEHELFNEVDRGRVFGIVRDYLGRHFAK